MQQCQTPPRASDDTGWGRAQALIHFSKFHRDPDIRQGWAVLVSDGDRSSLGLGQGSGGEDSGNHWRLWSCSNRWAWYTAFKSLSSNPNVIRIWGESIWGMWLVRHWAFPGGCRWGGYSPSSRDLDTLFPLVSAWDTFLSLRSSPPPASVRQPFLTVPAPTLACPEISGPKSEPLDSPLCGLFSYGPLDEAGLHAAWLGGRGGTSFYLFFPFSSVAQSLAPVVQGHLYGEIKGRVDQISPFIWRWQGRNPRDRI